MSQRPVLRIGLLVDDVRVDRYVRDLVAWASTRSDVRISHLVVCPQGHSRRARIHNALRRPGGWYELASRVAFRMLTRLEARALRGSALYADHLLRYDVSGEVPERLDVAPIFSPSGMVIRLGERDLASLRALELDVLIRCGSGILRGGVLQAARFGVLSLHHGDNRVNRGGPPGFWECYHAWPSTGFVIQRLSEELDGGQVLVRGAVTSRLTYLANQAHLYAKALPQMQRLLVQIAERGALPAAEERWPYSSPLFRVPQLHVSLAYAAKVLARHGRKLVRRARGRRVRWGITQIAQDWRDAALWRATKVELPADRFWADPFVIEWQGRTVCFVEDYAYATRRGRIVAVELDGTRATELGVALEEPFHLSFPFLFRFGGDLYMCPESVERRQIRVYRCVEFPTRWEFAAVLMDDVAAADSMLFERGGKWWLLTNIEPAGTDDHDELYAFCAEHPLSGDWRAHPLNPLKIDPDGGRNGGLVIEGDRIFRMGQRQGFDRYGEGLSVFEIERIDEAQYVERRVAELAPGFRPELLGVHHLSTTGRITVVDHVTHERIRRVARPSRVVRPTPAVGAGTVAREGG